MARFESKVVVITGGSQGMGLATARRLASEGASVVIGSRRKDVGEAAAADIAAEGGQALFVQTDVTVESDVKNLVDAAVSEFGRLDGAFNNAGGGSVFGPVHELDADAWMSEIDFNLTSVFYSLKYQVPAMLAGGGGSIVNNASQLGVVGMGTVSPYVSAKHALVGLTRTAALELAQQGIRVNVITPAGVDTPLFRGTMGATPEAAAHIAGLHPVNRVAAPEEIASFVAYLLSDETTFITGAALSIDGGWTAQ
ncbi:MAG TPA: glucose 1-dehydrogenase [Mycobacteriales bacterium]|jgi:NAD(P)-dependent dehydrogenase (short-subunit alcohol dehydrogenase family)|nr:glucose 1-dehydrogenase [Mycobacteriales bacterium]